MSVRGAQPHWLAALAAALAFACGGTTPPNPMNGPGPVDLTGTWGFDETSTSDVAVTQNEGKLTLSQNGSDISGTYQGTHFVDVYGTGFEDETSVSDDNVTGSLDGTNVTLDFVASGSGSPDHFEGSVQSDSMGGADWDAVRQTAGGASDSTPQLEISNMTPASGVVGTRVVIHGTGFDSVQNVTFGSYSAIPFDLTDTALTVAMPNAGSAGAHPVVVTTAKGSTQPVDWTQEGDLDPGEPNDEPSQANAVPFPVELDASFNQNDRQDFYAFSLTATTNVSVVLVWNTTNDLDVLIQRADSAVAFDTSRAAYAHDVCGNTGATSNSYEVASCPNLPAGDYVLHVIDYDYFESDDASVKSYVVLMQSASQ